MLVLTRKLGQSILIGKDIKVCILKSRGGQVQVGIKAPKEVVILRTELEKKK